MEAKKAWAGLSSTASVWIWKASSTPFFSLERRKSSLWGDNEQRGPRNGREAWDPMTRLSSTKVMPALVLSILTQEYV